MPETNGLTASRGPTLGSLLPTTIQLGSVIAAPTNFRFGELSSGVTLNPILLAPAPPALDALADFVGNWVGTGFNTIFRPNSPTTPTQFPIPAGGDNVLELNLTSESLSFSPSLGSVPNRGMVQDDAFLNGVPYLQSISDVTVAGQSIGIHAEPGLWMAVPPTTDPNEGQTYVRMASIPHGTTLTAQGTATTAPGGPNIPSVDITPSFLSSGNPQSFPSQNATDATTARIPQDLSPWLTAGTITQEMLTDPNSLLRAHISGQHIIETTQIDVFSSPGAPLFGGGTDNIAFLLGDPAATTPNAQTAQMTATFWIETVQHTLHVPVFHPGQTSVTLPSPAGEVGGGTRQFVLTPPGPITTPRTITFTTKQIQYSQTVFLNFNTLRWPHVSVATLIPAGPATVPPTAWTA